MPKSRIVVDTNILVSGFVFGGNSREVLEEIFLHHNIFVSSDLLAEYRKTPVFLEQMGKINSFQMETLIVGIAAFVSHAQKQKEAMRGVDNWMFYGYNLLNVLEENYIDGKPNFTE